MIKAENTAHVNTSVEKLYEFVTDPRNESKWHTDVVEVHPVTEGPPGRQHDPMGLQLHGEA